VLTFKEITRTGRSLLVLAASIFFVGVDVSTTAFAQSDTEQCESECSACNHEDQTTEGDDPSEGQEHTVVLSDTACIKSVQGYDFRGPAGRYWECKFPDRNCKISHIVHLEVVENDNGQKVILRWTEVIPKPADCDREPMSSTCMGPNTWGNSDPNSLQGKITKALYDRWDEVAGAACACDESCTTKTCEAQKPQGGRMRIHPILGVSTTPTGKNNKDCTVKLEANYNWSCKGECSKETESCPDPTVEPAWEPIEVPTQAPKGEGSSTADFEAIS